ncbi:hypothetical protein T484DRAFT_1791084 [Baffinella frigidus]|nr:hypothetical protein T484DRAFT_1791084 [Cryptophyta sp. CCMP2293]
MSRGHSAIALLLVSLHLSTAGILSGEARGETVCMPPPGAKRTPAMSSAGQATTANAPVLLLLRGGSFDAMPASASLAGTGRVVDMWDVNSFHSSGDGDVIVFRHSTLGTVVELHGESSGCFCFAERDGRNATWVASYGELMEKEAQVS